MTSARRLAAAVATQVLARQLPAGFAGPPSPRPDRPVLTLRAHRLPAVRLCLLFLAAVLSSAIVLALAASVDPSGATAASRPGYYFAQGNCYYRYPSGQYVQADPRACY